MRLLQVTVVKVGRELSAALKAARRVYFRAGIDFHFERALEHLVFRN